MLRPLDNSPSHWQHRSLAHKEAVHLSSALTAFIDTPNDERLPTPAIASCENAIKVRVVHVLRCLNVLARVELHLAFEEPVIGTQEAHGKKNQIGWEIFITP